MTFPPEPAVHRSAPHRSAAIISQGDELTLGQTLDTNSQWLAQQLLGLGIPPAEHVTLPDDRAAIADAFRRLARRIDLIICSGGLGPTADDLTRHALADAADDTLVEDANALDQIRAWFRSRGREMPELNQVQALRPTRGVSLENKHGTAPGLHVTLRVDGRVCDVYCLPGPPRELAPMWETIVAPALRPARTVRTLALHTIGAGESDIAAAMGDLMHRDAVPLVGTTASGGIVSVRIRYEGDEPAAHADALMARTRDAVRDRVGPYVFAEGPGPVGFKLAEAVVDSLRAHRQHVAVVESCTGGMLGSMLADVPGASDVYVGGWITYSNQMKQREVNVPASLFKESGGDTAPGAVSAHVALAMARGGLDRADVDHCLSITGVAGPAGGTSDKPVGTVWVALASRDDGTRVTSHARRFNMAGDRGSIREWASRSALAMLWHRLAGTDVKLLREVDRVDA